MILALSHQVPFELLLFISQYFHELLLSEEVVYIQSMVWLGDRE